uniref:Uncharacterized protein n=1 Tax=Steinernema glaseri TaxID=37863 RepID=A0A1I7YEL9_9BILA
MSQKQFSFVPPLRVQSIDQDMDSVPGLFIQDVCLSLQDRRSIDACRNLPPSRWRQICRATSDKMCTLVIYLDNVEKKIYAAACYLYHDFFHPYAPFKTVALRFFNNFRVEPLLENALSHYVPFWKEITPDKLRDLAHSIKPTWVKTHPVRYDRRCGNSVSLNRKTNWINGTILSMRLPVDSMTISIDKCDLENVVTFFENIGSIFKFSCDLVGINWTKTMHSLMQRTVDTIIEKFVPTDGGWFRVGQPLTREQIKRLVLKCEMSNKSVTVLVNSQGFRKVSELYDFLNIDKHYSKKEVVKEVLYAFRKGTPLELTVRRSSCHVSFRWNTKRQQKRQQKSLKRPRPSGRTC